MLPLTAIDSLKQSLSGEVLLPFDEPYEAAIRIDNGRIAQRPALVVLPHNTADVTLAIAFARAHHLPITTKSGGHSYAGYCLNDHGLVVDLSRLKRISLDSANETLTVELGCIWADVYHHLREAHSPLVPIGGACDGVGVSGFILGGGFSFISRSYGMGCDSLLALTLVTPDGVVHQLSADAPDPRDRDLFWACRGGGGGNFGIATEATIRLHQPRAERMMAGTLIYPLEKIEAVLAFYNEWAPTLPDTMAVYGYLGHLIHPATGAPVKVLRLQPVFNGDYADGFELIRPLFQFEPLAVDLFALPLLEYLALIGKITTIRGRRAYTRSGVLPAGAFTQEVVSIFHRHFATAPSPDSFFLWMHQGGATNRIPADATAYPHRDGHYIFEVVSVWDHEDDTRANVEWAYQVGQDLAPHFTGSFINYIDPLLPDWPASYYGENYPRLLAIKSQADPDNTFIFQQAIGSPFRPASASPLDLTPLGRTHLSASS